MIFWIKTSKIQRRSVRVKLSRMDVEMIKITLTPLANIHYYTTVVAPKTLDYMLISCVFYNFQTNSKNGKDESDVSCQSSIIQDKWVRNTTNRLHHTFDEYIIPVFVWTLHINYCFGSSFREIAIIISIIYMCMCVRVMRFEWMNPLASPRLFHSFCVIYITSVWQSHYVSIFRTRSRRRKNTYSTYNIPILNISQLKAFKHSNTWPTTPYCYT